MRYTIKLPQDQQDIVVDALRIYKETIESLCPTKIHNSFIHRGHNVDFPIYD